MHITKCSALDPRLAACHTENVPKIPGKRRPRPLPTPEIAEVEATAFLGLRAADPPTEAEQVLALVQPEVLNPDTGHSWSWEAQPNENAQEYALFVQWLRSGTECPRWAVARRLGWERRRVAWEAHGASLEATPEAMNRMFGEFVQQATMWLVHEISKHVASSLQTPQPAASVGDTIRNGKDLIMLYRLLAGQSTMNLSVRGTEPAEDLSTFTDEELATYIYLANKAKGAANAD